MISKKVLDILYKRGITNPTAFLNPTQQCLHNPFLFKDMQKAVNRIKLAVEKNQKILIYGDYDADGVSSTSLMIKLMQKLNANFIYKVPHRIKDGYGLHLHNIIWASKEQVSLIITVDTGITAVEQIAAADRLGMDVIVTDHHEPKEILPKATAIINPKLKNCQYPFQGLAGVGVAFKLACAILDKIPYDLLQYVAIGTVADMMPLVDENRWMVQQGLTQMRQSPVVGLTELYRVIGLNAPYPIKTTVVNKHHNVPYDVYIGRGSKWGNPFSHKTGTMAQYTVGSREEAVEAYRQWILTQPHLIASLHELQGKILCCYCAPNLCHGHVLAEMANALPAPITSTDIGFKIGPRINAAGRIDDADLAVQLLTTDSLTESIELAEHINTLNEQRQRTVEKCTEEARLMIEQQSLLDYKTLVIHSPDWHPGVVGLIASKLVEEYDRPAIVLYTHKETGLLKGSCRSHGDFNLYSALAACEPHLSYFGGHMAAAGLGLESHNLDTFRTNISAHTVYNKLDPASTVDIFCSLEEITLDLCRELSVLEPCGQNNPVPIISLTGYVSKADPVGKEKSHFQCTITEDDEIDLLSIQPSISTIMFGGTTKCQSIQVGNKVSILGNLNINVWNNHASVGLIAKSISRSE
ncbi:Single-stranded-DNA-specific exonuclease RecJ [compost metagenome]